MFTPLPQKSVPDTLIPPPTIHTPPTVDAALFRISLFCSDALPPDLYHPPPYPLAPFISTVLPDTVREPPF